MLQRLLFSSSRPHQKVVLLLLPLLQRGQVLPLLHCKPWLHLPLEATGQSQQQQQQQQLKARLWRCPCLLRLSQHPWRCL
jgi:hypothetical protein